MTDDFQIVKRRRKKKNGNKYTFPTLQKSSSLDSESKDIIRRHIKEAENEIKVSVFFTKLVEDIHTALKSFKTSVINSILCYGLGSFSNCNASYTQLAVLIELKKVFCSHVYVHDPVFSEFETEVLCENELTVITDNEEGKREIVDSHITLLYSPHCPKQLINNFLWKNWGYNLQNCIILCNSFSEIVQRSNTSDLLKSANYIQRILPYTTEIPVQNTYRLTNIFNDLSIHFFPSVQISLSGSSFWDSKEEPNYDIEDTEFIRTSIVSKLNYSE